MTLAPFLAKVPDLQGHRIELDQHRKSILESPLYSVL